MDYIPAYKEYLYPESVFAGPSQTSTRPRSKPPWYQNSHNIFPERTTRPARKVIIADSR